MQPLFALFIGVMLGIAFTALFGWGWLAWRESAKQRQRPGQVIKENRERLQKAKEEAAKGRRKLLDSVLVSVLAILVLFVSVLFIVALSEGIL